MSLRRIKLPVTFGEITNYRIEFLTFEVADIEMAYHAILRRLGISKSMGVTHYTYMMMKIPGPKGPITIKCDPKKAYACDKESVELAMRQQAAANLTTAQFTAAAPNSDEAPSKIAKPYLAALPTPNPAMSFQEAGPCLN